MHIWKKAFLALAAATIFAGAATPKDAAKNAAKDAKSSDVVGNVAKNIGAADLKSVHYTGSGFAYAFGQSYLPGGPYPKFYAKYSRDIDFGKKLSSEDTTRTQFENPPRGGGGQPLYREARGVAVSGPDSAWGGGAVELTPQGWAKAAMESSPATKSAKVNGKPGTLVTFMHDKYKIEGYVDGDNLLEKVDTWTPNPILGDMLIETTYSDYKDFGGIKFPTKIAQSQGGHPVLEITVADVQPNASVNIKPPNAPPPTHVEAQKIGDGVWYLAGTPDPNAMAVEFKDYVVVIESSVTEARALANIAKVKELVPNKPIRYHINSHHHSDHAAGLRAFVAEGSTIITHESNKNYYEKTVLKNPHTLDPDRLTQEPKPAKFIWVKEKYELSDGDRTLDVYWVHGAGHTSNLLMSYLPKERILFITDIFNQFGVPRPNDPPPGIVTPYYAALGDNLKRLNLDPVLIAPSHGKEAVSADILKKDLVGKVEAPPVGPPK
ncbi:MAG TPA: MBL fold metallo-hydrolase [Candidatus Acidoferrales bacterium]|jgi:glyoxylase-like metal-dependent hydrolase (beta-lactamase superfamily II)|nr:MBL fold metallo-hydrolase [Candidatus Acidoferrales bacterium]